MKELRAELDQRRADGLYRQRRITEGPQSVIQKVDGRQLLSFCSNDYLGLANHPEIKSAFIETAEHSGVGSGAAHLITGHSYWHEACEEKLAEFTGRERALLFSTGYMANLAIASALLNKNDIVIEDKLNHASLIDAARLSDADFKRYAHADLTQLDNRLQQAADYRRRLIMTDGVFSMDGDCADLHGLSSLAAEYNAWLMVDDAHGFGVLGNRGAGLLEAQQKTQQEVPVLMATLGKAAGCFGAFVAGSEPLIETLIQSARSYIYTTATPPALAAATVKSLEIIEKESWRREKLAELIDYFRQQMTTVDLELMPSETAIQPILVGDNHRALKMSESLLEQGVLVTAIRPPTVPAGSARLRVTLSAEHEKQHIDQLVRALVSIDPG